MNNQTYGEGIVESLLKKLPTNDYFYRAELELFDDRDKRHKPDFVLVIRKHGIAVIEVKDWVKIVSADQDHTKIRRRDGVEMVEKNPMQICDGYSQVLSKELERQSNLMKIFEGRKKLMFPWQSIVILPNIHRDVIQAIQDRKIWQGGVVLGKEDLVSVECFEEVLNQIPWVFPISKPLSNPELNSIRLVVKPSIAVDNEGGVLTIDQELLSEEALKAADDVAVRLVRGVAGSGKSLVLARRAMYISQNYPELKVCVMAFNKNLADDLRRRIPDINIEVITFHKMCSKVMGNKWKTPNNAKGWIENYARQDCEQIGLGADFIAEEIEWRKDLGLFKDEEYLSISRKGRGTGLTKDKREKINDIFDRYIRYQKSTQAKNHSIQGADWSDIPYLVEQELQNEKHPLRHHYDMILIDEAQDFAPSWIKCLSEKSVRA